jgi:hypothetical protein
LELAKRADAPSLDNDRRRSGEKVGNFDEGTCSLDLLEAASACFALTLAQARGDHQRIRNRNRDMA